MKSRSLSARLGWLAAFAAGNAQTVPSEFVLNVLSGRRLRRLLATKTPAQIRRVLKRLRLHGLIRRVGHTSQLSTSLGHRALVIARKLTEHLIIPALAPAPA